GPDQAAEQVRVLLQPIAAPLPDLVDELAMGGLQYGLPELPLILALGLEGVEKRLVLTRSIGTALHAQLVQRLDTAEAGGGDTDRTDQAGLVGVDLVRRCRNIIGTGRADVGDHGIQLDLRVQRAQPLDLIVHIAGLYRTATRTVDAQHHTAGLFVLEGPAQTGHQVVGAGLLLVGDGAAHLDQGRMRLAGRTATIDPAERREQE